ncbi:hypothetical protein AB0G67_30070 [Streptomyces sp. NPDC021056]|uniref:acyl-CoA-like ligand-binding transcription factor n=1 Tax=Streptomyces sp. NPDC021056 TaxID=3155012 RepID=UPI0033C6DA1E
MRDRGEWAWVRTRDGAAGDGRSGGSPGGTAGSAAANSCSSLMSCLGKSPLWWMLVTEFAARRTGLASSDLLPRLIGHAAPVCVTAYEHWLPCGSSPRVPTRPPAPCSGAPGRRNASVIQSSRC